MIEPHGGTLINKVLPKIEKERIKAEIDDFEKVIVKPETIKVIKNISFGAFSPLEGFMNENDYHYVLDTMYLENNIPWPFPITLDVSEKEIKNIKVDDKLILVEDGGTPLAMMNVETIFDYEKKEYAEKTYGTLDQNHPGVNSVFNYKEKLIGGEIFLINEPKPIFSYL
ncbi:MAG: sulfate adenylyltransferase, partial [Candidatus Hodarchaeota archaeon]